MDLTRRFAIIVHGGAGNHPERSQKQVKAALKRACIRAADLLRDASATALDAVEAAIREMEDEECLNAGYGSNLTIDGKVECDAALMEGRGAFGSIGAVSGIKNPITAGRYVLENGRITRLHPLGRVPPMTLVADGVVKFCSSQIPSQAPMFKVDTVPIESLISVRASEEWRYWTNRLTVAQSQETVTAMGDTVGAIVLCDNQIAAGVSSGGLLLKYSGRVGEAAVYGAGCWAASKDASSGVASSVSGTGEQIMRGAVARSVCEACSPSTTDDPIGGLTEVFKQFIENERGTRLSDPEDIQVGTIVLHFEDGESGLSARLLIAFTTPSFAVGSISSDDLVPKASIHRQQSRPSDGRSPLYVSSKLLLSGHGHSE
ncbi:hypothetical protein FRC19_000917 [Serendipita sp. 401]|nr:hypothetical protein FRC19_000917 [Serendipita sp. 401]